MVRATLRRRPDAKSCIVFWKYEPAGPSYQPAGPFRDYEPAGPFYDSDRENSQNRSFL